MYSRTRSRDNLTKANITW